LGVNWAVCVGDKLIGRFFCIRGATENAQVSLGQGVVTVKAVKRLEHSMRVTIKAFQAKVDGMLSG
jgi:hypothetical protein